MALELSRSMMASICACDLKHSSGKAVARWPKACATGSPGRLSDMTPASEKFGWPAIRRSSSPAT